MKEKGQKRVFLVRDINGKIISAITMEELEKEGKLICVAEPKIYLSMTDTWSWDNVKWAKFDGTKSGDKNVVDGFSIAQLIAPVYQILSTRYDWEEQVKKRFMLLWSASASFMKNQFGDCYYCEMTGVVDPAKTCHTSKGAKCVSYNEKFAPIAEAKVA